MRPPKIWDCWNLCDEDIRMVAQERGIVCDGFTDAEYEQIARLYRRSVENNMDGWDGLLAEAILRVKGECDAES